MSTIFNSQLEYEDDELMKNISDKKVSGMIKFFNEILFNSKVNIYCGIKSNKLKYDIGRLFRYCSSGAIC